MTARRSPDVWRPRLPERELRGRFLISESAIAAAERLLPTYRGPDGDHEGIVLLLGHETPDTTLLLSVIAPEAEHAEGRVIVSGSAVASATAKAHVYGLAVLGQIHTHPAGWTEHSEGDDELVLMRFEGMLSIVAPHYARFGLRPLSLMGVHQRQGGEWVRVSRASIEQGIVVFPTGLDMRKT